ncbi:MAG TPA: thioredoxin domain-containing protein [Candidatus Nanoarchaeia archaeon]|nr:thioredoxin domain-containing protein [Candidatus Nanoarchaeia archaeon]
MKKNISVVIIICLLLAPLIYFGIAVKREYDRNSVFQENYLNKDYQAMYNTYLITKPEITNRAYLGNEKAPLTIIVVVDFASDLSKKFYYEKVPEIIGLYVEPGYAKLYHKYPLTQDEFNEKRGRFIYANAVQCYTKLGGKELEEFHKELFNITEDNTIEEKILALSDKFGVLTKEFTDCLEKESFEALYEDMMETRMYRIQGPSIQLGIGESDYTVLFGNPSISQINKTIRTKQVKIGI